jgi:hypothetical protein
MMSWSKCVSSILLFYYVSAKLLFGRIFLELYLTYRVAEKLIGCARYAVYTGVLVHFLSLSQALLAEDSFSYF